RVEELDLRAAFHHQLALLIFGPQLKVRVVAPVLAEPIDDAAFADHGVARPHHLDEANGVFAKLGAPRPVGDELAPKPHHQHSRSVDGRHPDAAGVDLIDVDGIEVSGRSGIAGELNAIHRRLRQGGQLVAHVHAFEVQPTGGHQSVSLVARTTRVRRARTTRLPSSSRPSSWMRATSFFPAGPWRSKTSATRVET